MHVCVVAGGQQSSFDDNRSGSRYDDDRGRRDRYDGGRSDRADEGPWRRSNSGADDRYYNDYGDGGAERRRAARGGR